MTNSALYRGSVMHRRYRPRMHYLRYRIFQLLLDLDEVGAIDRELRLFSRNRFNLVSFHDRDFGDGSGMPLRDQIERLLSQAGIARPSSIQLLTMPRVLGFAFNPLSLYFCNGREGRPRAIVYEVHNTFKERHFYVIPVTGDDTLIRQRSAKAFHVSPFLPMALDYDFRVWPPGERLSVAIAVSDRSGPLMVAVQAMRRGELSDRQLLSAAIAFPLMTIKVVAGILWEAGRLWLKRVAVRAHPGPAPAATIVEVEPDRRAEAA